MKNFLTILSLAFALSACKKDMVDHATWAGKWNGPEGTYMEVKPLGNGYSLAIADLDGEKTFDGVATREGIEFERDGQSFVIKAGTGDDTGMKWLAGKKDCLIVAVGEGYCRD